MPKPMTFAEMRTKAIADARTYLDEHKNHWTSEHDQAYQRMMDELEEFRESAEQESRSADEELSPPRPARRLRASCTGMSQQQGHGLEPRTAPVHDPGQRDDPVLGEARE